MKIFALDLGTNCGWAIRNFSGGVVAGTWKFTPKKKGANCCDIDPRLLEFGAMLDQEVRGYDYLVYEDVKFVRSQAQAHLWAGFRAVMWLHAHALDMPTLCCPVQTLKKFATGKGNADKDDMALAYYEKAGVGFPGESTVRRIHTLDDNAIDAWHLLHWAEHTLTIGKKSTP